MLMLPAAAYSFHAAQYHEGRFWLHERKPQEPGTESTANKNEVAAIVEQSTALQGWSILILGGLAAVLVTTNTRKFNWYPWAFIALGPGTTLVVGSLYVSLVLGRLHGRYIFLNNYRSPSIMRGLLSDQSSLLIGSLFCIGVFISWYLFGIVAGSVRPYQEKD